MQVFLVIFFLCGNSGPSFRNKLEAQGSAGNKKTAQWRVYDVGLIGGERKSKAIIRLLWECRY